MVGEARLAQLLWFVDVFGELRSTGKLLFVHIDMNGITANISENPRGNCIIFTSDTEDTSADHCVNNAAGFQIHNEVVDFTQLLIIGAINSFADEFVGAFDLAKCFVTAASS